MFQLIRQRIKLHLPADQLGPGAGGTHCEWCPLMWFRAQVRAPGNSFAAVDVKEDQDLTTVQKKPISFLFD